MISAQKWQLLSFFETEPACLDPHTPWPYNEYLFKITQNGLELSCFISPAYKDVRIILSLQQNKILEFNIQGAKDVCWHNDDGQEKLEIITLDNDKLWFQLKPRLYIEQKISEKPGIESPL